MKNGQTFKDFLKKRKLPIIITGSVLVVCITVGILFATGIFSKKENKVAVKPADEKKFNIISVEPTRYESGFMACDSGFIVRAEYGDAELVRKHILISNGPEYTVEEKEAGEYEVAIKGKFASNKDIKVQFVKDGAVLDSWAFETETKLEIAKHYPDNNAYGVATNSVIELEMTLAPDEKAEEFIKIYPETKGRWEQIGKILRFTPSTFLDSNVDYTVSVASGMKSGEIKSETDYNFTFHTYEQKNGSVQYSLLTVDGINYYKPNEPINIRYNGYNDVMPQSIELYKFNSAEDIISYSKGIKGVDKKLLSNPQFTVRKLGGGTDEYNLTVDSLETGYYLAETEFTNGGFLESLIQVNPISCYACASGSDILVWAEKSGISVKYKEKTVQTDQDGLAILKDVLGEVNNIEHVYVGDDKQPLVIGIKDIVNQNYPNCYVYTDKPKYKTDDKISVWGCVPNDLFYGSKPDFAVKFVSGSKVVETVQVAPDENGTFTTEISYKNIQSDKWARVELTANDKYLATKYFEVDDYELQNYNFYFSADKNYVWGGENYDFDIKVEHISGIDVSGKRVRVNYNGVDYFATSNEDGLAHFSINIPKLQGDAFQQELRLRPIIEERTLYIYNGDVEEQAAEESALRQNIYLLKYDKNVWSYYDGDKKIYQTRNVNTSGINFVERENENYNTHYNIENGYFETTGKTTVFLTTTTRERIGETFDPYKNTYVPQYSQSQNIVSVVETIDFTTEKGKYVFDGSKYTVPESTEFVCYSLKAETAIDIKNGWTCYGYSYMDSNYFKSVDGDSSEYSMNSYYYYSDSRFISSTAYNVYGYKLDVSDNVLDVGEKAEIKITDYKENQISDGKVLRIVFNDSILDTKIYSAKDNLSFELKEEYLPSVSLTCAYYKDGKYWRLPVYDFAVDQEKRDIKIETKTTKENYGPSDEVTVNIKTTDANGKPLSCAVNLSVVNEAVFGGLKENLNLGSSIINYNKSFHDLYTFSTYRDYELAGFEGGKGGGDGDDDVRRNFVDTACFKSVVTDEQGNATITFTLPDSITTYRMTTHAASGKYYYGTNVNSFAVTSDFFLQSTAPKGLKDVDDFVANANTVSTQNGTVDFKFEILETGNIIETSSPTNTNVAVNFGKLPLGEYTLKVTAEMDDFNDAVEYKFDVVVGSLTAPVKEKLNTSRTTVIKPTSFPVVVDIYSKTTEKYLDYLEYLQTNDKDRLDKIIASYVSYSLQNEIFGKEIPGESQIYNDNYRDSNNVSAMFEQGSGDIILTAFDMYYSARNTYINESVFRNARTPREAAERLFLDAARGNSVLYNLKQLEKVADDDYTKIIIALSYCYAGDYNSANRVYNSCDANYSERGYKALYATVATFVDTDNAQKLIDSLLREDEGEYYLPFAVLSFIENRSIYEPKDYSVTVKANKEKQDLKLGWLEVRTLVFYDDGSGKLSLSFEGDEVAAEVNYQDYDKKQPTNDFTVRLKNCNKKYDTAVLEIDLGRFVGQNSKIDIVLPPSLRASAARNLKGMAYLTAKREKLTVSINKKTSRTIQIPLVVTNEGDYTLESVRLTDKNGEQYYSDSIRFNVKSN